MAPFKDTGSKTGLVLDSSLAEYVSAEEHFGHANYARWVSTYHELKGHAVQHRLAGDITEAVKYEAQCDEIAKTIEEYENNNQ
jgi:hypothetical protein